MDTSVYITESHPRKEWREHLIGVAIANDAADEELGDFSAAMLNHAAYAVSDLIASATYLETESTGDLIDAVYARISAAREERAAADKQRQRERWLHAAASGGTDKGFREWLADRD